MRVHQGIIVAAVIAGTVASGGVAVAELTAGSVTDAPKPVAAERAIPVADAETRTKALVPALRRPQLASDRAPTNLVSWRSQGQGASVATSRRLKADKNDTVYVVAARGGACIASESFVAAGCSTDEAIASGDTLEGVVCSPFMDPDEVRIFGLLPDGAKDVVIVHANGKREPLRLNANYVDYTQLKTDSAVTAVEWTGTDGPRSESPLPNDVAGARCDRSVSTAETRAWARENLAKAPQARK